MVRRASLVFLMAPAVLLSGAGAAWAEGFTDPDVERPGIGTPSSQEPAQPAEDTQAPTEPAATETTTPEAPSTESPATETSAAEPPSGESPATESPAADAPNTERLGTAIEDLAKENPLLARVNGEEIRWRDILKSAEALPEEYRGQIEVIFPALLQRLIDLRLVIWAGRESGLAEDQEIRRRVAEFEERAISDAFIQRNIASQVSEEMVRQRYDRYVKDLMDRAEVRARHILLDSDDAAKRIISMLDSGSDFAELARAHSIGPTAELGGDLDYFTRDDMTPAFSEAAFALDIGDHSPIPVRTEFGWHVIKVEDRRIDTPRLYSEMRGDLREAATRELMDELLRDLRGKARIELYPEAQRTQ